MKYEEKLWVENSLYRMVLRQFIIHSIITEKDSKILYK